MPILNADKAQSCPVIKRGKGAAHSGIENALLRREHLDALRQRANPAVADIVTAVKTLIWINPNAEVLACSMKAS